MAKDKSEADLRERKEKKDKKRKREEGGAAADAEDGVVSKKEKKDKKRKSLDAQHASSSESKEIVMGEAVAVEAVDGTQQDVVPLAALVPFANPLADEKAQKKVLKSVKRAAKNKTLKRGVKECVKAIRKSPLGNPATLNSITEAPSGIVIIAADISPMDVISHIPVLCEDHNIPYIFVPSRAELGAAGNTKRPTSVVLVSGKPAKGKENDADAEWEETYKDLHKLSLKLGATVKV